MKKSIVRLILSAALIVLLVILGGMDTTVEKTIRVNASYYDVALRLNDLKSYRNWYPGFSDGTTGAETRAGRSLLAEGGKRSLSVKTINPSQVVVTELNGEKEHSQSISAIPLPDEKQTEVLWSVRMPWYKRISNFFTGRDNIQEGLINLKASIEDPALRYGFSIALTPVSDTIILTAEGSGADSSRVHTLQVLHDTLAAYILRNKPAGVKDYYYVTSNIVSPKKTEFAVGIPVNEAGTAGHGIDYLRLPSSGRVLVGKAKAGSLRELYTAMNRYANDQGLQKVAQELEKYSIEPEKLSEHPESEVELVFPVY